jgi:hypothetical protein
MITLVLKEDIGRDRIVEAVRKMGLELTPTEAQEGLFWQLWMSADKKSAVHYIEDSFVNIRYFSVRGRNAEEFEERLREALPVWERDELLKHALFLLMDGSDGDRRRVAMEVAHDMVEYDPASAGVLQTFLEMNDPSIRLAGARAFRTLPWPIFRPTARKLAADADPEIAALGEGMLARIEELHGDE